MIEDLMDEKTSQLIQAICERYRHNRVAHVKRWFYTFSGFLARMSLRQKTREKWYLERLIAEAQSQSSAIADISALEEFGRIPTAARRYATVAAKTMAQRLKSRADFLGTVGGMMTVAVTAMVTYQKVYANVELSPPLVSAAFLFFVLALVERHLVLEEVALLDELHELFKS